MKVVIIGGVAGGATAAARLRRLNDKAEILLLERGKHISYANCGLPYYIGGEIPSQSGLIVQTPERFKERFNIDVRVMSEAVEIHPSLRTVLVRDYAKNAEYWETYDELILSPGAEPVKPPIPGTGDKRIFTLRSLSDAVKIREYILTPGVKRAVVVGGGFIGVETAENLVRAGLKVSIVEMGDHLIPPLDYDVAAEIHAYLKNKSYSIDLHLNTAVKAFYSREGGISAELTDGKILEADMAILAAGVIPDTSLAESAGVERGGRGVILVDEHMRTNVPHIYAVGDAVEVKNAVTGQPAYIPLAGPANKQGRIAADNICGIRSAYKGTQGSSILKFFDITAASTGLNERAAASAGFDYDKTYIRTYSHATYYPGAEQMLIKTVFEKKTGRILGAQIVGGSGVDKRCDLFAVAVRAKMTAQDLTEMELCYAPPFSSAKDPVNITGYAIENILTGKVRQFHWNQIPAISADENAVILDVRTEAERKQGFIANSVHVPLDELREMLRKLDKSKAYYVHCRTGLRSYIACRILAKNGFDCYNLAGGYVLYETVTSGLAQ